MATSLDRSSSGNPRAPFEAQRQFKKHKILPRPQHDHARGTPAQVARAGPTKFDLAVDRTRPSTREPQPSSKRVLKHQPKRIGSGPDMPPTPPRQSRKPPSNAFDAPPSPTIPDSVYETSRVEASRPPVTPPNQKSPPTPDVTPPQNATATLLRPRLHSNFSDRGGSRTTVADSQTGSFRTAREDMTPSEDEEKKVVSFEPLRASTRSISNPIDSRLPKPDPLGLALESLTHDPEVADRWQHPPAEMSQPDGDWSSASEVEQEWDHYLRRMVTVKRRSPTPDLVMPKAKQPVVVEPNTISQPPAARAVRNLPLHQRADSVISNQANSVKKASSSAPSSEGSSGSSDAKRTPAFSARSTSSTVVGAAIVAENRPQKQRTLRHVRKQGALRLPTDLSPSSTMSTVVTLKSERSSKERSPHKERPSKSRTEDLKHDSYTSTTTVSSVASSKARREVWKSGGIPVVVVPDRRSSRSKSREPSLRSHSSRRSSRRASLDVSEAREQGPVFQRPTRRGRAFSESDGSDERTADFPPVIPPRSSSLSAPTSRNVSRTNSLTAESIKLHNALQESLALSKAPEPRPEGLQIPIVRLSDDVSGPPSASIMSDKDAAHRRLSSDRHDDFLFVKGHGSQNTPFSLASVETNGTALEVSEALAVHMYPHQNSSVLMVDHSTKPSESSDEYLRRTESREAADESSKSTVAQKDADPVTPPQAQSAFNDVDSPLRNPRAPPEPPSQPPSQPPAINFIPATPSGMTPAYEKAAQMGNYFEATRDKPPRRPSLVRRAFSQRRRHSVDYPPVAPRPSRLLTRRFSLSRKSRDNEKSIAPADMERGPTYPSPDDSPAEENKLHPFWRPQWSGDDSDECDCESCRGVDEPEEQVLRYPPVDNRPRTGQRTLSAKVKRTFAILPREEEYYSGGSSHSPDRQTIRRTPSGNLRVLRHRQSSKTLKRGFWGDKKRQTTSAVVEKSSVWRGSSSQRRASKERRRRSLGSRFEGIQNFPRKIREKRREKRSEELRQMISGPREVRDGIGEVIRPNMARDQYRAHGRTRV